MRRPSRTTLLAGSALVIAVVLIVVLQRLSPRRADEAGRTPTAGLHPGTPSSTEELFVSVRNGEVTAPDSASAGWTRLTVAEDGNGHVVVAFRLPSGSDITAFLAALDTTPVTPLPGLALGGPEIGDSGAVFIELTPERYVLACVSRGADGHRHALGGEAKVLTVVASPELPQAPPEPRSTAQVRMVDFAYVGAERWPPGSHVIRVENTGKQDHQMRINRLPSGATLSDWWNAEKPNEFAQPIAGVARMGSGTVAYLPVELLPGSYAIYCLIADPASDKMHVELGMMREIHVTPAPSPRSNRPVT